MKRGWQDAGLMSFLRLLALVGFVVISPLNAQQSDIAPPNYENIAREIEGLEQKQKQGKQAEKSALMNQIQTALMNGAAAASFYTQAVESVQFKGKRDKAEAFSDWRKSHSDLLRTKEMQTALLLHLKYLLLSLQRKGLDKPATMLPALTGYLNEVIAADEHLTDQKPLPEEARNLMGQPLNQSVFCQWLQLGEWLPDEKSWELKPGDVAGILEKNVRSIMRETKDPQIIGTWDLQMKVEADRITTGRSEYQADQFNSVTRPRLLFKRAQDMVDVGQPNRALAEMVALVKTYPAHPDFGTWLARIRESIKAPAAQTSPQ